MAYVGSDGVAGGVVDGTGMVVVAGGARHSCRAMGRNRFLVLDWAEDAAAGADAARLVDGAVRRPFRALDPMLLPLLRFLDTAVASDRVAAEERRAWGGLLLRRLGDAAGAASPLPIQSRRLSRALGFVEANLAAPITVADIAEAAQASTGHLHDLFRRHLGRPPMAHVARLRLERAMRQLAETDLPIAEVALASGYSEQSALTRALKRAHGVTPAAYRRRHRSR